ncbi:hypothetical protein CCP3SC1AL1_950001 [Gammaproteobacteria bacterium]
MDDGRLRTRIGLQSESFPDHPGTGIWEATWWSISTIISGGCENKAPIGVAGRLIAVVWMLGGIGLTSCITATLASAMINTLVSDIHGISDLKGQTIATVTGSSTETFLKTQGFTPKGAIDLNGAIERLLTGGAKAVVYDGPMLRYYLSNHAESPLQVSGDLFEKQNYGFALQLSSPLRKHI